MTNKEIFEMKKDLVLKNLRMRLNDKSSILKAKKLDANGTSKLPNVIMDSKMKNSVTFNFNSNFVGYASIDFITTVGEGEEAETFGFYAVYVNKDYHNMGLNKIFLNKLLKPLEIDYVICIIDEENYYMYNSCHKAGFIEIPDIDWQKYIDALAENNISIKPGKKFFIYFKP